MTHEETVVTLYLNEEQVLALAQFVKRLNWTDFREKAMDDEEADTIRTAVDALQPALQDTGYAPR